MSPAKRRANEGENEVERDNAQDFIIDMLGAALLENTGEDILAYCWPTGVLKGHYSKAIQAEAERLEARYVTITVDAENGVGMDFHWDIPGRGKGRGAGRTERITVHTGAARPQEQGPRAGPVRAGKENGTRPETATGAPQTNAQQTGWEQYGWPSRR